MGAESNSSSVCSTTDSSKSSSALLGVVSEDGSPSHRMAEALIHELVPALSTRPRLDSADTVVGQLWLRVLRASGIDVDSSTTALYATCTVAGASERTRPVPRC